MPKTVELKRLQNKTLVYCMGAQTRRQSPTLFDLSGECVHPVARISHWSAHADIHQGPRKRREY